MTRKELPTSISVDGKLYNLFSITGEAGVMHTSEDGTQILQREALRMDAAENDSDVEKLARAVNADGGRYVSLYAFLPDTAQHKHSKLMLRWTFDREYSNSRAYALELVNTDRYQSQKTHTLEWTNADGSNTARFDWLSPQYYGMAKWLVQSQQGYRWFSDEYCEWLAANNEFGDGPAFGTPVNPYDHIFRAEMEKGHNGVDAPLQWFYGSPTVEFFGDSLAAMINYGMSPDAIRRCFAFWAYQATRRKFWLDSNGLPMHIFNETALNNPNKSFLRVPNHWNDHAAESLYGTTVDDTQHYDKSEGMMIADLMPGNPVFILDLVTDGQLHRLNAYDMRRTDNFGDNNYQGSLRTHGYICRTSATIAHVLHKHVGPAAYFLRDAFLGDLDWHWRNDVARELTRGPLWQTWNNPFAGSAGFMQVWQWAVRLHGYLVAARMLRAANLRPELAEALQAGADLIRWRFENEWLQGYTPDGMPIIVRNQSKEGQTQAQSYSGVQRWWHPSLVMENSPVAVKIAEHERRMPFYNPNHDRYLSDIVDKFSPLDNWRTFELLSIKGGDSKIALKPDPSKFGFQA